MHLQLHDFFPDGKHYVQMDVFLSVLLACLQERLPDRKTKIMKDGFQAAFLAIRFE